MEKHVLGVFWRACVVLTAFAFTTAVAKAQLLNGSFESPGTNFIYQPDANGVILTNTSAAGWTPFELGFRTGTNSPSSGTYTEADFGYTYPGINNSGSATTAHTGSFAARLFGPFSNFCCTASGLFQTITNSINQAVSNNQVWVFSGYGLNWSGDPLASFGADANFGLIQIQFLDAGGAPLGTTDGPHLGTDTPVDTWISCTVTATAPAGTAQVTFFVLHVGMTGALGSIFWDDLSVTNIGVTPPPPPPPPLEPAGIRAGVQVCWPTVVNTSYQPQYSDDNVVWVNIIATNAAQQLLPGDGTTNCIFSTSHKFYRVVQTPGTVAALLNGGFESGTSNQATSWIQFNNAFRLGTNDTQFGITVHSGGFSLQTYGPLGTNFDASGAYQDLPASAGQNWRLTGYCLNWQNNQLSGPDGFAKAELQFLDSTNGVIATIEGSHFGTDVPFPLDTWQFFEVDARNAPAGTATVRVYVLHVGRAGDLGSVWWDDLTIYQPIGSSSTTTSTVQPAVQVYWPTASPTNGINYQVQSIPNLVFTNVPAVNVLSNAGFEASAVSNAADTSAVAGWILSPSGGTITTSSSPNPTHTGIGAMRMTAAGGVVPVALQVFSASPGQVWDFQGYLLQTNSAPLTGAAFALLKIVWQDSANNTLNPVPGDTNLLGTAVTGQFGGIEAAHVTAGSSLNTWLFCEARGTAPSNTTQVQVLPILVANGSSGTIRFDDLSAFQPVSTFGWANFGPVFPGNGNTNQVFDPIGANRQKFYRVFTP
jgi:hypothetical protein